MKRRKQPARRNFVTKHMRQFSKAVTMTDRKKRKDRGYSKHKGNQNGE